MSKNKTMTPEQYVLAAITAHKKETGRAGLQPVWSGFNVRFKEKFPKIDPVELTKDMAEHHVIAIRPIKGGVLLFLPGDSTSSSGTDWASLGL